MSVKLFQDLLASFKRSNKDRKLKLAQKAGYTTVEDYKKYLESQITGIVEDVKVEGNLTDMVIAFDTTGSMSSYISSVKQHVKDLIPKLFSQNPGLKISVVAFGDYCDMSSATNFGKAYQVINLTDNENDLIDFVNKAQSTAGGDADEFYELVIQKITNETEWREGSGKSVLLIADCNPHRAGFKNSFNNIISPDWRVEAQKAAEKGIIFDTLQIIPSNTWYKELSQITGGVCLPFKNSSKTADLMEATSLARGGEATKSAFMAKSVSKEVTMDGDMNAVYGMYKTVVKK